MPNPRLTVTDFFTGDKVSREYKVGENVSHQRAPLFREYYGQQYKGTSKNSLMRNAECGMKINTATPQCVVFRGAHKFKQWNITAGVDIKSREYGPAIFKMPNNDVTLTAFYERAYTLTVSNGDGSGTYYVGEEVEIKGNKEPAYQKFKEWQSDYNANDFNKAMKKTSFKMSEHDVEVTAEYEPDEIKEGVKDYSKTIGVSTSAIGDTLKTAGKEETAKVFYGIEMGTEAFGLGVDLVESLKDGSLTREEVHAIADRLKKMIELYNKIKKSTQIKETNESISATVVDEIPSMYGGHRLLLQGSKLPGLNKYVLLGSSSGLVLRFDDGDAAHTRQIALSTVEKNKWLAHTIEMVDVWGVGGVRKTGEKQQYIKIANPSDAVKGPCNSITLDNEKNNEKITIQTKAGRTIVMDDEKNTITISGVKGKGEKKSDKIVNTITINDQKDEIEVKSMKDGTNYGKIVIEKSAAIRLENECTDNKINNRVLLSSDGVKLYNKYPKGGTENTVLLNAKGIKFDTNKDVTINAEGEVNITSKKNVNLKAGKKVTSKPEVTNA